MRKYTYYTTKTFIKEAEDTFNLEKEYHEKFEKYSYTPNIKFCGSTECFNKEILTLI